MKKQDLLQILEGTWHARGHTAGVSGREGVSELMDLGFCNCAYLYLDFICSILTVKNK